MITNYEQFVQDLQSDDVFYSSNPMHEYLNDGYRSDFYEELLGLSMILKSDLEYLHCGQNTITFAMNDTQVIKFSPRLLNTKRIKDNEICEITQDIELLVGDMMLYGYVCERLDTTHTVKDSTAWVVGTRIHKRKGFRMSDDSPLHFAYSPERERVVLMDYFSLIGSVIIESE